MQIILNKLWKIIFGTSKLVDAAINFKVEKFIFVSTDKAVRPTNIMGSSKRLAELYIQSRNKEQTILFFQQ
ncbi:MAG: hypothetical protein CM15mP19_12150 [Gammaproteobacteria bacterium]|nr:MAG: hypothetical protein CM15mP19_12150 [Gammaproteobacteria bacterium]